MNTRSRFALAAVFVALSAVVSVLAAPELPDQIFTNWNAAGQPDGTMGKLPALALMPALSAILLLVFAVIPRIDPLRENLEAFRPYYGELRSDLPYWRASVTSIEHRRT